MSDAPVPDAPSKPVILTSPAFYDKFNKVMDEFTKQDLESLKHKPLEYQKNHPLLAGSETLAIIAVIIHYMLIYYYNGTVNIALMSTDNNDDKCMGAVNVSNSNNNTLMALTGIGIMLGVIKLFVNNSYRSPVIDTIFSVIMFIIAVTIVVYVSQINNELSKCSSTGLNSLANAKQQMNALLGWSIFGLIVAIVYLGASVMAIFGVYVPVYQQEGIDEKTGKTNDLVDINLLRAQIKQE